MNSYTDEEIMKLLQEVKIMANASIKLSSNNLTKEEKLRLKGELELAYRGLGSHSIKPKNSQKVENLRLLN